MYDVGLDMSLVDFAVRAAIKDMSDGIEPTKLTADEIAEHIGCCAVTVRRTLPRLIESGKIARHGSKRTGYWYEVKEDRYARSR